LFARDVKVEALRRAPLFAELSKKELAMLARMSDDLEVPAGRVLCREGERGQEFFVLMDGEVEVTRRGRRVSTGRGGDFFGEISIVERMPRTATVTAKTQLRLFVLTGQAFRSVLDRNPAVERKVMVALARRLAEFASDPGMV
jgi:CRP/FNR family transcriptional regulator, cyclic AMP receptor protein